MQKWRKKINQKISKEKKIIKKKFILLFQSISRKFPYSFIGRKKKTGKKIKITKEIHIFHNFNQYPENSYIPSSDNSLYSPEATKIWILSRMSLEHLDETKVCPNYTMNVFDKDYDDMSTCKGTPCIRRGAEACQATRWEEEGGKKVES